MGLRPGSAGFQKTKQTLWGLGAAVEKLCIGFWLLVSVFYSLFSAGADSIVTLKSAK
jgi:hypothetical protein